MIINSKLLDTMYYPDKPINDQMTYMRDSEAALAAAHTGMTSSMFHGGLFSFCSPLVSASPASISADTPLFALPGSAAAAPRREPVCTIPSIHSLSESGLCGWAHKRRTCTHAHTHTRTHQSRLNVMLWTYLRTYM